MAKGSAARKPSGRALVAARILALPAERQGAAMLAFRAMLAKGETKGAKAHATRIVRERRKYAGDPWAYFRDVFGYRLTDQQDTALEFVERVEWGLLPSANNTGKTFLLSGYGVYRLDAVAALEGDELEEQGGRVLLPGPDHPTIFATIYSAMLVHAARAERRGHLMPGRRSEASVLWQVRPEWAVEAFSPPAKVSQDVAHTASGRHHRNQVALIEEGQGTPERVWRAAEGMCSSAGNKIISPFNPTETSSPAYKRAVSGTYRVHHLSAFDHPNMRRREYVVPDAIDYKKVDKRVRAECAVRGRLEDVGLEPTHHDFLYAVPPQDEHADPAPEEGPRADGVLGHPAGTVLVYRPGPTFTAQVLGKWPATGAGGLFQPATLQEAITRWRARSDPPRPPDAVGIDPAREGSDDSIGAPRWGEGAEDLLRAYAELERRGEAALAPFREARRQRVGALRLVPKGDGPATATAFRAIWPASPWHMDEGTPSPYDYARRVLGVQAIGVHFAGKVEDKLEGEPWTVNVRARMYVRAARLVALGLVDVPDDPALLEELLAHFLIPREKTVDATIVRADGETIRTRERVEAFLLVDKEAVKKEIGRSPDRADAFVLAVNDFPPPPAPDVPDYASMAALSFG